MATNLSTEVLKLLKSSTLTVSDKFSLLKRIERITNENFEEGKELILRLLSRRNDFLEANEILNDLIKKVGLYPYLNPDNLSLKDALAYEMHRPAGMGNVVFHSMQTKVYYELMNGRNVILSAPTSYGKSLIIDAIICSGRFRNILIIVPTIALIDETRKRLSKYSSNYTVITSPRQDKKDKNIFIFTQERAIDIIDDLDLDFYVIDEFYKLSSDDDSRYQILNTVFYKLLKRGIQFYLLGPNVEAVDFGEFKGCDFLFIQTDYKTVVTERHILKVKSEKERLEKLIKILMKYRGPSLIYCKSPKSANNLVEQILQTAPEIISGGDRDFSEWLKSNYHPDWIFAKAVAHGLGIHHGKIPRALAQYVVKLFNDRKLSCLVCTSSLIEGVNTIAENVIIYDRQIANKNLDYFTFSNICGRSGRMFKYFIGNVFLFKDPPKEDLPSVSMPILTQTVDTPDSLIINLDLEDLSRDSRARIQKYLDQDLVPIEVLRANSCIPLDRQLSAAKYITDNLLEIHKNLSWTGTPSGKQIIMCCNLIYDNFHQTRRFQYGVSSGRQLAYRIFSLMNARDIGEFIRKNQHDENANKAIETSLDVLKYWINFKFPCYLRCLCRLVNSIFRKHGLSLCDYRYFADKVENYFYPYHVVLFDEYGLPMQIGIKLSETINFSNNIDEAINQLKEIDVNNLPLSSIEKAFISNTQKYL